MPWDKSKSIAYLQSHALPGFGHGHCARAVREAISEGGLVVSPPPSALAKDFGPRLLAAGFLARPTSAGPYSAGDVAVIDGFKQTAAPGIRHDHPAGHMAMFDGTQWISDYKQTGTSPYAGSDYDRAAPSFVVYRRAN